MLPWPKSFREDKLVSAQGTLTRESVLARIPPCRAVLAGGDVADEELPHAAQIVRPEQNEAFLRKNARLTAEGALATVMRVKKRALMRETALVTGYGRIGQEMTARLLRDGHVRDGLRAQRKPDAHGACGGRASRAAGAD